MFFCAISYWDIVFDGRNTFNNSTKMAAHFGELAIPEKKATGMETQSENHKATARGTAGPES